MLFGIIFVTTNCKTDDTFQLRDNSSFDDLKVKANNINSSKIPQIMNFIKDNISKDLYIRKRS